MHKSLKLQKNGFPKRIFELAIITLVEKVRVKENG
jgi:hypothetical protein